MANGNEDAGPRSAWMNLRRIWNCDRFNALADQWEQQHGTRPDGWLLIAMHYWLTRLDPADRESARIGYNTWNDKREQIEAALIEHATEERCDVYADAETHAGFEAALRGLGLLSETQTVARPLPVDYERLKEHGRYGHVRDLRAVVMPTRIIVSTRWSKGQQQQTVRDAQVIAPYLLRTLDPKAAWSCPFCGKTYKSGNANGWTRRHIESDEARPRGIDFERNEARLMDYLA